MKKQINQFYRLARRPVKMNVQLVDVYYNLLKAKAKRAYWNADKVVIVAILSIIFFLILAYIILF